MSIGLVEYLTSKGLDCIAYPGMDLDEDYFEDELEEQYAPAFSQKGPNNVVVVVFSKTTSVCESVRDIIRLARCSLIGDIKSVVVVPKKLFKEWQSKNPAPVNFC